MALPKAIQRQVDQAAAAEQNLQLVQAEPGPTVVENVAQLLQAPPAESANPLTAPAPATPPAPSEDWQQKYRSLQGIFAQKTGELQAQVKSYESQLSALQKQVADLAAHKEAKPARPTADPKDVESFGADMIDMVQRYAEQVFQRLASQFGQKVTEFEGRLAGLEQKVSGVSEKTDNTLEQQFYATLGGLVPDWEQINTDPRWLQWLGTVDPIYGAPRQAALDAAHQRLDAQRVASVFKAFKASLPAGRQDALAQQVAPSGAAGSVPAPAAQQQKSVLSAKSVEKFYRDLAQGKYAGREAEAAKLEAEIDLAAAEGRIR
jgi:hypothetical protein